YCRTNFIDFKIQFQKQRRISNELKELIKKYRLPPTGKGMNQKTAGAPAHRSRRRRWEAEADLSSVAKSEGGKESRSDRRERGLTSIWFVDR
ncbi:hypothetical protein COV86_00010, partial [Candidatus Roizmanbacteria bacterium CG11_big_fil_rev_8_21_14_0_20_35_14]